jgi:hypothetical protein
MARKGMGQVAVKYPHQLNTDYLFVRCDKMYVQVAYADILYLTTKNRFCLLVSKYETLIVTNSLDEVERFLPRHMFTKIHMGCTVAIARIKTFDRTKLQLHPPETSWKRGYADRVDFKIGLAYQSKMRDPLMIIVGRSGGDAYQLQRDFAKTKMEVYEEELDARWLMLDDDSGAVRRRKRARTGACAVGGEGSETVCKQI